jgi:aubergine-like protein
MGPTANGSPNTFDIEQNMRDIDRKIQGKMFTQPALKTWGIFYADRDAKTATEFKSTMAECLKTCGYEGSDPNMCQVKPGMKFDAWKKELKAKLNDGIQMVVMILAGTKARCPLYDDLKKFLLEEYPIPSQVVLNSTISKGKNLRSIVSKILIKMNAKVGGVPWAVDNLPFMSTPTMIMGMDVFHSTALGKKSVLALTASMNQSATTYWSTSATQDEIGQEAANNLQNGMKNAMEAFKKNNGAYPARVIFYRDGVGEGQV